MIQPVSSGPVVFKHVFSCGLFIQTKYLVDIQYDNTDVREASLSMRQTEGTSPQYPLDSAGHSWEPPILSNSSFQKWKE